MASVRYLVYADGACKGNPGPGGWGAVVIDPRGQHSEFNGRDPATTNNKMELTAAIEGLRRVPRAARVTLRSDSQYVVKTMNEGWKRNANRELWAQLDGEVLQRRVEFEWVRGHGTDPLNDSADRLANLAVDGVFVDGPAKSSATASIAEMLSPLLRPGESVIKCLSCGRDFVAATSNDFYCALAPCQLKARSAPTR